jgi:hypothetical protein
MYASFQIFKFSDCPNSETAKLSKKVKIYVLYLLNAKTAKKKMLKNLEVLHEFEGFILSHTQLLTQGLRTDTVHKPVYNLPYKRCKKMMCK